MTPFDQAIKASLEAIQTQRRGILGFLGQIRPSGGPLDGYGPFEAVEFTDADLSQWEDGLSSILDVYESVNTGNTANGAGLGIATPNNRRGNNA